MEEDGWGNDPDFARAIWMPDRPPWELHYCNNNPALWEVYLSWRGIGNRLSGLAQPGLIWSITFALALLLANRVVQSPCGCGSS